MAAGKDVCVRLGGLISGLADNYGGERGPMLRAAGKTLAGGKSSKEVTDVLELALTWSSMPSPQIADALTELTGHEPELPEPRHQELPAPPEEPSPVAAKKAAAKS